MTLSKLSSLIALCYCEGMDMQALEEVIETVRRLRAPDGCPWDRAQTHQSLRPYLIEEAYEVLDVIDRLSSSEALQVPKNQADFREELGDLLMQVLLHSAITQEAGVFGIADVARALNTKLVTRHPHVFGDVKVEGADAALANWEKQKAKEKAKDKTGTAASVLDGLPKGLPALQRTARVIEKVTKVGFQWPDLEGPWGKVEEELSELKTEVLALEKARGAEAESLRARVASELGDLFFTLANVASLLKIAPEDALRETNARFERRFRHVEARLREQGRTPEQSNLEEMDRYWDEAKAIERGKA